MRNSDIVCMQFFLIHLVFYLQFNLIYVAWMLWHNLDNSVVLLQKFSVSEWFAQKLELKLRCLQISVIEKIKMLFLTQEFQTRELWSAIFISSSGFPRKCKNSLKKKKYRNWTPVNFHANLTMHTTDFGTPDLTEFITRVLLPNCCTENCLQNCQSLLCC